VRNPNPELEGARTDAVTSTAGKEERPPA
jgi:hypothetical protein